MKNFLPHKVVHCVHSLSSPLIVRYEIMNNAILHVTNQSLFSDTLPLALEQTLSQNASMVWNSYIALENLWIEVVALFQCS